jgi:hypothetical protein
MVICIIFDELIITDVHLIYHAGMNIQILFLAFIIILPFPSRAIDDAPMADIHLHFNWNQEEIISAEEVLQRLRKRNVTLALVTSVPSDNAVKLRNIGGDWIFPFYSPYINAGKRDTWFIDQQVIEKTRAALESKNYFGIGEMHLVAGAPPTRENRIVNSLFSLAQEFKVPVLIHTDSSSHKYFEPICKKYPDVRFLWAHAGGILEPDEVIALMESCGNVWVEFSARDPWHYSGLVDEEGKLYPGWLALIKQFPDRVMTGTDPVWNAHQIYRWYEADEGWDHYGDLYTFHRNWMKQLPPVIEEKVRFTNARKFLYADEK